MPSRLRLAHAAALLIVVGMVACVGIARQPLSAFGRPARPGIAATARSRGTATMRAKQRTRKELDAIDPDEYMRYLRTGEEQAATKDRLPGARAEDLPSAKRAEAIAAESSKGFLDPDEAHRWYLVQCTPGFERSIERTFMHKVHHVGLAEDIVAVEVPLRRSLSFSARAKAYVDKEEPLMPGYVMVRMRMRRNLYNFVRDCESVLGFCGYDFGARNLAGGLRAGKGFVKPKPLSEAEVARIHGQAAATPQREPLPEGTSEATRAAARKAAHEASAQAAGGADPEEDAASAPRARARRPAPTEAQSQTPPLESEAEEGQEGDDLAVLDAIVGGALAAEDEADLGDELARAPRQPVVDLAFGPGDAVRVLKGPFKDLEGSVAKVGAPGKDGAVPVDVELQLMGQATVVALDATALAPLVP
mmetsp:Transcript_4572/g.15169  ORF Transcript_4572/g.15169 Transcript_4572/m.15169 type:complete len:419 (+) Transcript_4572:59-1315(+)